MKEKEVPKFGGYYMVRELKPLSASSSLILGSMFFPGILDNNRSGQHSQFKALG